jgi:hypothetical protein
MRETERQKTERLLREQLARVRQAETAVYRPRRIFPAGDSRIGALGGRLRVLVAQRREAFRAFAADLFSKPRSIRRIETTVATARKRLPAWPMGKRGGGRRAELQENAETLRGARALDELYAAAAAPPPPPAGRPRFEWPASGTGRPADARKHDLRNISEGAARLPGMKDVPTRDWGPPPKVQFPKPDRKKDRRSDLVIAALGVALGLTCALFPWYIFFNQEQFGVQAIAFGGRGHNAGRITVDPKPGEDVAKAAAQDVSRNLDLFSTGTLQVRPETPDDAPGLDQQPFPAEAADFKLVHVANGRAMIEDDAGLWIVQQGSSLPDSTRVRSIEKRKGQWVLVTSADRVVEVSK